MCIHCEPACFVVCSTKTCPTTRWTGWASRPPCTETRTAPGPCRRCTSTTGPSCTLTSTRTPPTPTPCLPVWAPPLTTLSREIKTLYTGRCKPPVRAVGETLCGGGAAVDPGPEGAAGEGYRSRRGGGVRSQSRNRKNNAKCTGAASHCRGAPHQGITAAQWPGQAACPAPSVRAGTLEPRLQHEPLRSSVGCTGLLLFLNFCTVWTLMLLASLMFTTCFC